MYQGKTVAITGAANGLGKGMALRFAQMGANLSLADISPEGLATVERELRDLGIEVATHVIDVTDYLAVEAFADRTFETFGKVDYLINNAGIGSAGIVWNLPLNEWHRCFNVNVMGIVHGIKAFVPRMIDQEQECYVINTASNAGLTSNGAMPAYTMSKHAAVSVTETLAIQLQIAKSRVKTFVYCPGFVVTGLYDNTTQIRSEADPYYESDEFKRYDKVFRRGISGGMSMDEAMDRFFAGLEADNFYIRTHPGEEQYVQYRIDRILTKTRPTADAR